MYNSVFYKSLSTNDYDLFFVQQPFVEGGNFTVNGDNTAPTLKPSEHAVGPTAVQQALLHTDTYERLNTTTCISAYAVNFLSSRRNLVLVSKNGSDNNLLYMPHYTYEDAIKPESGVYIPFDW